MKKTIFILTVCVLWSVSIDFAQTISDVFNDGNLNYFQKLYEIEKDDRAIFNSSIPAIQKRYFRYRLFWDNRIDNAGSSLTFAQAAWDNLNNQNRGNKNLQSFQPTFEFVGPYEIVFNRYCLTYKITYT